MLLWAYRGSKATFNAYRREVERLLHWQWMTHETSITTMDRATIESYVDFCRNPSKSWITDSQKPRFVKTLHGAIPNPKWRPFVAKDKAHFKLSSAAVAALLAIISTFFQFLIAEQATSINPVALIRQKVNSFENSMNTCASAIIAHNGDMSLILLKLW